MKMQTGFLEGLGPRLLRKCALALAICYLACPWQQQLKSVLHTLAHAVEMPETLITHDSKPVAQLSVHAVAAHYWVDGTHSHAWLDFIDDVVKAFDDHGGGDGNTHGKLKFDKHFMVQGYTAAWPFPYKNPHKFAAFSMLLASGHGFPKRKPPKIA